MRIATLLLVAFLTVVAQAEDAIPIVLPKADIRDVLSHYERLTGRKVYLALGVVGSVHIETPQPIPKAEAVELIRRTLLESAGIVIRDNDRKESFVDWSDDPKHRPLRDAAIRGPGPLATPKTDTEERRRIRMITPNSLSQ